MEPVSDLSVKQTGGTRGVITAFGALYLGLCLCLGGYVFFFRQQIPVIQNYFPTETPAPTGTPGPTATPTPTATSTPTPTLIAHLPASGDQVFRDDFSEKELAWWPKSSGNVTVKDGQLYLSSPTVSTARTQCQKCFYRHGHFYIEADFSTDRSIDNGYGLAFNINPDTYAFYLFDIDTQTRRYSLYKTRYKPEFDWMLRISRESSLIKPYPQVNKLGVSFNKDYIELYINGQMVDSYRDPGTDLTYGEFGFFVDNTGFQVIVDNLYTYGQ